MAAWGHCARAAPSKAGHGRLSDAGNGWAVTSTTPRVTAPQVDGAPCEGSPPQADAGDRGGHGRPLGASAACAKGPVQSPGTRRRCPPRRSAIGNLGRCAARRCFDRPCVQRRESDGGRLHAPGGRRRLRPSGRRPPIVVVSPGCSPWRRTARWMSAWAHGGAGARRSRTGPYGPGEHPTGTLRLACRRGRRSGARPPPLGSTTSLAQDKTAAGHEAGGPHAGGRGRATTTADFNLTFAKGRPVALVPGGRPLATPSPARVAGSFCAAAPG